MKRVLVVEDDQFIKENLTELLSVYDYQVDSADNGIEALKYLETNLPELIISDVLMSGMDGIKFRQKLLEAPELGKIPFVFLTAINEKLKLASRKDLGDFLFIPKPYKIKDIEQALKLK